MWKESGDVHAQATVFTHYIDTTSGQSGAPMFRSGCGTHCAIAVHAYGYGNKNLGVRIVTTNGFINGINKIRNSS